MTEITYASIGKRLGALALDRSIIAIPMMLIVSLLMSFFFESHISVVYPIILMVLIYCPYALMAYLIVYPAPNDVGTMLISIMLMVIVQTIILTSIEMIYHGDTLGRRIVKIQIIPTNHRQYNLTRRLLRNLLEAISLYLFFIPALSIFWTPQKQTSYDIIVKTVVVEKQKK